MNSDRGAVQWTFDFAQRSRADAAGGITPTGVDRSGAQRSASLERVFSRRFDGAGCRRGQPPASLAPGPTESGCTRPGRHDDQTV
jgi:hypothetical protein